MEGHNQLEQIFYRLYRLYGIKRQALEELASRHNLYIYGPNGLYVALFTYMCSHEKYREHLHSIPGFEIPAAIIRSKTVRSAFSLAGIDRENACRMVAETFLNVWPDASTVLYNYLATGIVHNQSIDMLKMIGDVEAIINAIEDAIKERLGRKGYSKGYTGTDILGIIEEVLEKVREVLSMTSTPFLPRELVKVAERVRGIVEELMVFGATSAQSSRIIGVRRMRSFSELSRALPGEQSMAAYARITGQEPLLALQAYKLASKQVLVYDTGVATKPVIFIDVSGSMMGLPLALAKAVALGLIGGFRGAYKLYAFDDYPVDLTLVTGDKPGKQSLAVLALNVRGGTNIANVLNTIIGLDEEAKKKKIRPFYIIISDTQDNVPSYIIEKLKKRNIDDRVVLVMITTSPTPWTREFKHKVYIYDIEKYKKELQRIVRATKKAIRKAMKA